MVRKVKLPALRSDANIPANPELILETTERNVDYLADPVISYRTNKKFV